MVMVAGWPIIVVAIVADKPKAKRPWSKMRTWRLVPQGRFHSCPWVSSYDALGLLGLVGLCRIVESGVRQRSRVSAVVGDNNDTAYACRRHRLHLCGHNRYTRPRFHLGLSPLPVWDERICIHFRHVDTLRVRIPGTPTKTTKQPNTYARAGSISKATRKLICKICCGRVQR